MHDTTNTPAQKINRLPEVKQITGLSRSTIYAKIDKKSKYYDATFPRPKPLGARSIGWIESEVQAWIESRRGA